MKMKMEKLDQKQLPQVIGLGVLCAGVLGYAAYSFMGQSAPPPTAAAGGQVVNASQPVSTDPAAEAAPATGEAATKTAAVPMALGGQFNPDPFRPAVKPVTPRRAVNPPTTVVRPSVRPERPAPELPAVQWTPRATAQATAQPVVKAAPPVVAKPTPPPAPVRPSVLLTGVIDAEEGSDMALVKVGENRQILHVGDKLPNNYQVKSIQMDGLVLVNVKAKDRFFVALGAKPEETKPAGS